MDRARFFYLAAAASAAFLHIDMRDSLPDNSDIVQIRFYAVIRTPSDGNLKFMREHNIMIAHIKSFMQFFTQAERIQQSVLTRCSLTGHHRTHL